MSVIALIDNSINNLWSIAQYGFRKNRSCNTQLMEVVNSFQIMADLVQKFDCVYVDFYKAFDKVSITILLKKCQKYGI